MRIAVISDLHLGSGDAADQFGHKDDRFLRFLKFLEDNFERIVLLGDIWETLTPPVPVGPLQALRAARNAHPGIAERFEQRQYHYVHGNHDLIAHRALGAPEDLVFSDRGTRILFTHGHHHDLLIRRARWLSELGVWLGGWLLRWRMGWIHQAVDRLEMWLGGVENPRGCSFQRWAVSLAKAREADIVVTGHTHVSVRAQHTGALFLNSGSCSGGRFSFLALDTGAGSYDVHSSW
jgi:predicted phosphodiesterase